MTDDPDDPGSRDELLSADLDGETSPSERARIEADPALRERRQELSYAADSLRRQPEPLPPAAVDALVARALDAVDTGPLEGSQSASIPPPPPAPLFPPLPVPVPLSRPRRISSLLVAAAIVALVAIGVGVIVTTRSPNKDTNTAVRKSERSAEAPRAGAPRAGAPTGDGGRPTTAPSGADAPTVRFIGRYSTPSELRSASKVQLPPARPAPGPKRVRISSAQADRCAAVLEARDPRLRRSNRRTPVAAAIGGDPVVVFEYRTRSVDGTRLTSRVIAVGVAACDERLNFER